MGTRPVIFARRASVKWWERTAESGEKDQNRAQNAGKKVEKPGGEKKNLGL